MKEFIIQKLRRITTSGNFIPEIDGLRFVAISTVVLFHISESLILFKSPSYNLTPIEGVVAKVCSIGYFGVELFFVISGFILALPFASYYFQKTKKVSMKRYFMRRLTRLEPPYLISILLLFFLMITTDRFTFEGLYTNLFASLTYLHNIIFDTGSRINYNAWSLEIEVQFYILTPLLVTVFKYNRVVRRVIFVVFIIVSSLLSQYFLPPAPRSILLYAQYFGAGLLLADIYLTDFISKDGSIKKSFLFDLISLLPIGLVIYILLISRPHYFSSQPYPFLNCILPILLLVFCMCAFKGRILNGLLKFNFITIIGGMCYSIYLIHAKVVTVPLRYYNSEILTGDNYLLDLFLFSIAFIPAILIISTIFYITIERPCMDRLWPQKLWSFIMNRMRRVKL